MAMARALRWRDGTTGSGAGQWWMTSGRRARTAAGNSRAPGMRRAPQHQVDDTAVGVVDRIFTDELQWLYTRNQAREYGIDGHAEAVTGDGIVTGRVLATQVKGGASRFRRRARDGSGWVFWASSDHLHYWLGHSLPVLVILVRPDDGAAFWQVIRPSTVTENAKGFTMVIPSSQRLDALAGDQLRAIAVNDRGLLESFPGHCAVLPPSAERVLVRARDADPLPAARLAEKLATGRDNPAMTVSALCSARPAWLAATTGVQDLWLAAGRYAHEHGCAAEAAEAFALAAAAPGPRPARAHAVAGLAFLSCDRARARAHLEQAHAGGELLLADIGLAELAVPEGDRQPRQIPASVLAVTPDELNAEPMVLGFLAGAAMAKGDFLGALRYRERQWAASRETDTGTRLALADAIRRQALTDPDSSGRELQRTLSHAMAAMHERRRWDGPSDQALAAALDILIVTSDWAAMLDAALPAERGGRALPREANSPIVARRAAVAADARGDGAALEFFLQALPDSSYRSRLQRQVARLDAEEPAGAQAEAWLQLLEDSGDDESAVVCIAALARLGVWPPRAEELLTRAVLPPDTASTLRAVYLTRSGRRDEGLARLREIAARTVLAALDLVDLMAQDISIEAALAECQRQRYRWRHHPGLSQRHASLLERAGRDDEAAQMVESLISDQGIPAGDRMRVCDWLAARKAAAGDLTGAENAARDGLAIGPSTALAWTLIRVLLGAGRIAPARETLARHRPCVETEDEARLWFELHLAVPLAIDDARTLLDLAARHPGPLPPARMLPLLHREAVLARNTGQPYPPDLLTAIENLAASHDPGQQTPASAQAAGHAANLGTAGPEVQAAVAGVREGRAAQADIAEAARVPYGTVLLHRDAGMLPAVDLNPAIRTAGETAAAAALEHGGCVADLSAVHTLQLLPARAVATARALLPGMAVSRDAVRDAVATRDHVRFLGAADFTMTGPGSPPQTAAIDPADLDLLTGQALYLETIAGEFARPVPATRNASAAEAAIAAAAELGLSLWCDDTILRQRARSRGVPSFSVLDLTTVLRARGADIETEDELARHLAAQGLADMPLTGPALIALAAGSNWQVGAAHAALARPGWWASHDSDWVPEWRQLITAAATQSAEALTLITGAAITGAIQYVPPSRRTQRYQQLASLAIAACHTAGRPVPTGFLATLAQGVPAQIVPESQHVRTAVADELASQGVPGAQAVAIDLLPEVALT
jgi:hypothetical protein